MRHGLSVMSAALAMAAAETLSRPTEGENIVLHNYADDDFSLNEMQPASSGKTFTERRHRPKSSGKDYTDAEKAKNRAALKKMGLSTNVNDWPGIAR